MRIICVIVYMISGLGFTCGGPLLIMMDFQNILMVRLLDLADSRVL